tara:strand:- start:1250 stop:2548 length:1299 start_codon:yes stop_codon:yes gene_type:complete
MEIKIKHGKLIYHKWHWVRRVPIRLQHKHGKRIGNSTGHSDPYAAERQIQAWDAELERSGLTTSTAEDYQAELKRIAALEVDEMGNNEVDHLVTACWRDIGEENTDVENELLFDKIPTELLMAHAASSELRGSPREPAFAFKLQDALVIFKRDKAEEKEDYYLKMYSTAVRLCTASIPEMPPLPEVKRSYVREWLKNIKPTTARSTRLMHLSRLGQVFEYAQENENISGELANPFKGHKLGKSDEKPRPPMADDQLLVLLKATVDLWHRLPPIIARHTGMRHKEIFYSSLVEVDSFWCLDISATADGKFKPKTANSKRIVPLHSSIVDLVRRCHSQLKKRNQRTHVTNFSKLKRKHFPDQEDLCFHSLRHSFITYAMREEVNPTILSQVVGHKTLKGRSETENRYLHGFKVNQETALVAQVTPLDLTGIELP